MYRILIVDDEPIILKSLQTVIEQLDQWPVRVSCAGNGVEALEKIHEEQPDFLFTDIRMPRMDGMELCRIVFERQLDIQTVIVSGYNEFEYAQKCLAFGVKEYLLKPISRNGISETIGRLIHNARKRANSYPSITRLDEVIGQMEEELWFLLETNLQATLTVFKAELLFCNLPLNRLKELLEGVYTLLFRKLAVRDVHSNLPKINEIGFQQATSDAEAIDLFEQAVYALGQTLKQLRKGKTKDVIEQAKAYIIHHLAQDDSLEDVAQHLGINATYLSQMFKTISNETFIKYRIRLRMEKAKKMLENPSQRITDISFDVGYSDYPHFTKTFRKYAGCSPSEYRKMLGIDV
jgi:two-component system response regulator YesN